MLVIAAAQIQALLPAADGPADVPADSRYHCNATVVAFAALAVRGDVSEPDRDRPHYCGADAGHAMHADRRRPPDPAGRSCCAAGPAASCNSTLISTTTGCLPRTLYATVVTDSRHDAARSTPSVPTTGTPSFNEVLVFTERHAIAF